MRGKGKMIKAGIMLLMAAVLCVGCGKSEETAENTLKNTSEKTEGESENGIINQTGQEAQEMGGMFGAESPTIQTDLSDHIPKENAVGYIVEDMTWEQKKLVYTGDELEVKLKVTSSPDIGKFSLLIYVDGVLTPYYSSQDKTMADSQIFQTKKPNEEMEITLYYKPLYGEKGKSYVVNVEQLDNPEYMLKDKSYFSFMPFHTVMTVSEKIIEYQCETNKLEDVCTKYDVKDLDETIEGYFENELAEGGSDLNNGIWIAMLSHTLDRPFEEDVYPDYFSVKKGEKLKVYLPFLGESGKYRVSMYINHKLIQAFDGKSYLDVNIQRDKYTEKVLELDVDEYSGLNHMYIMAVQLDKEKENRVQKDDTILLEVLDG